ncbi:MAG: hypothetical protein M1825_005209 [Sarcosagium campestre]|nr:MAG: hypothetical protein M1825_005209 [Sarcosagium campestre]
MRLPLLPREQQPKEQPAAPARSNTTVFVLVAVCIFGSLAIFFAIYLTLRRLRVKHQSARYVPTQYLKRKWMAWSPNQFYKNNADLSLSSANLSGNPQAHQGEISTAGIDRNTSIRSVVTLPAYNPNPGTEEQVLGREGERAGIDRVVEFPEDAEEEERRRDTHMESLYQIRLGRRNRAAERDALRREADELRERGDVEGLIRNRQRRRQLREDINNPPNASHQRLAPAGAGSDSSLPTGGAATAAGLSATELVTPPSRGRRVSSVSYADVGLARHDGSRIRGDSIESDRPLLDGAASIGGGGGGGGDRDLSPAPSRPTSSRPSNRNRNRSTSSLSVSTNASDGPTPQPARPTISTTTTGGSGHPQTSDESTIFPQPPDYEDVGLLGDAPPYESPSRTGAPRLPVLSTLPAIQVTVDTPPSSAPVTPLHVRGAQL